MRRPLSTPYARTLARPLSCALFLLYLDQGLTAVFLIHLHIYVYTIIIYSM